MNQKELTIDDSQYQQAIDSLQSTLSKLRGCSAAEQEKLQSDITQLNEMVDKITKGRVEIVIFGEISTGKSAMINALIGKHVAEVDVQGGWTKEVWGTAWDGSGHRIPGLDQSEIVLVDTPGINEVGGLDRAELAETTARKADLILFVTDSDLNDTEYSALLTLAAVQKPIILVLNKTDLYSKEDLDSLLDLLAKRVDGIIPSNHIVTTSADPREVEYVIEADDGSTTEEWRKPEPLTADLKSIILKTLDREGMGLIALNAALYAADKSDRISTIRVAMRNQKAEQVIWTSAATKAMVVAFAPGVVDVFSGIAIDALMLVTLSKVYGLNFSMAQARDLSKAITKAAGVFAMGELTSWGLSWIKAVTVSLATAITAIPQGAAAGFSSYIIGQAAKRYFEQGGSWGHESAKSVVADILKNTDKDSVLSHLKDEIRRKLDWNRHAKN
ncbi:MAG: GTP-binding protein [Planctomycetota bacterium]